MTYTNPRDGCEYEIYLGDFHSKELQAYHKRIQYFLLYFIDRSSYIDDTDKVWEVLLVQHISPQISFFLVQNPYHDLHLDVLLGVKSMCSALVGFCHRTKSTGKPHKLTHGRFSRKRKTKEGCQGTCLSATPLCIRICRAHAMRMDYLLCSVRSDVLAQGTQSSRRHKLS